MQLNTKPKRGAKFIIIDTGEEITLNRIKENGEYFCDFDNGSYQSFQPDELKPVTKGKTPISSKPKVNENKAVRSNFYDEVAKDMPFNCMNCQKPLYSFTKWSKRCCSAHCLPKSLFPSIAENKDNIVFMGVDIIAGICDCHTQFDYSVENRIKMPIYNVVLKRFELLKSKLNSTELISAYEYLGIPLTKEILNQIK